MPLPQIGDCEKKRVWEEDQEFGFRHVKIQHNNRVGLSGLGISIWELSAVRKYLKS